MERKHGARAARKHGLEVTDEELQQAADTFRDANGPGTQADESLAGIAGTVPDGSGASSGNRPTDPKWQERGVEWAERRRFLDNPELDNTVRNVASDEWLQWELASREHGSQPVS